MPPRLRVVRQDRRQQLRQRRGRDRARQEPQARSLPGLLTPCRRRHVGEKRAPRLDLTAEGDRLGPIRIVQIEDGRLSDRVGSPETGRMLRVAFDFGRTPHMAFDQDRLRNAGQRDRAGEKQGTAGDDVLGLLDVGNNLFGRLFGARADSGERERRAHQLQELTPAFRVVPLRGLLGEFPVQVLAELERIGQFAEAAPVHAAFDAGQAGSDNRRIHAQFSFQLPATSFPLSVPGSRL